MRLLVALVAASVASSHSASEAHDITTLVQTGSSLPVYKRWRSRRQSLFPLMKGERHYAGSASFSVDVAGMHIYCYDVAVYINKSNPVWGNTTNRKQKLDSMLGDVVFVMEAKSSFVSRKALAGFVDRLPIFAEELGFPSDATTINDYKAIFLKGPKVQVGSEITLVPGRTRMTPWVDGREIGHVNSTWLGRCVMEAYLGRHSDLPEFRDQVWSQLAEGFPREVGEPAQVSAEMGMPKWIIAVIAIACVVATLVVFAIFFFMFRKKAVKQHDDTK